jgi:hypothetical protein
MTSTEWLKRQAEDKPPSIQSIAAKEQWRKWREARGLPPDWRYAPTGEPADEWFRRHGKPVPEGYQRRRGGRPRRKPPGEGEQELRAAGDGAPETPPCE